MTPTAATRPAVARKPVNAKADRHFVTALARGLEVLSAFRSREMLGNQELARRCGLPKSTVSRLTYTLTKLGYLERAEDAAGNAGYRLGSPVLGLGSAMLARMDIRAVARPLMQELADRSQAMVSLGMRDRLSMIYVENCRSESALTLSLDVGSRIPVATTAMGRAYLAVCRPAERTALLSQVRERDPASWARVEAGVERAVREYEELGCCTSFGEWQKDVNALAIAFRPQNGRPVMAINCGGPGFKLTPDYLLRDVRPLLLELGERLEAQGASAS